MTKAQGTVEMFSEFHVLINIKWISHALGTSTEDITLDTPIEEKADVTSISSLLKRGVIKKQTKGCLHYKL